MTRVHRLDFMLVVLIGVALAGLSPASFAQTSSLGARQRTAGGAETARITPREAPVIERNAVYEQYSWVTTKPVAPKTYRVGDLITIVIRESRKFEADADLETKTRFDVRSELEAFFALTNGGLGSADFHRGRPNVDYRYDAKLKGEGDTNREDRLTTRLTGRILDVKPNGILVLEARARVQHDDEISEITLTGICRKEDVTVDNTVLSTQIANKEIAVNNKGAIRSAAQRGWIPRLIDLIKPF
jgi:flagellar L-ring protein precursor FlgH